MTGRGAASGQAAAILLAGSGLHLKPYERRLAQYRNPFFFHPISQAESSVLEAQVRALQDSLDASRSAQSSLAGQLADAKAAAEALRQDRDHLQRQNIELSEKLQAQVRAMAQACKRMVMGRCECP